MLLTDGWWGGRVTENTSVTAGGSKTVKQNQSHVQLAGSRCARWGLHVHPQHFLSNLFFCFFFLCCNLLHTRTSSSWLLPHISGIHVALMSVHQVQLSISLLHWNLYLLTCLVCRNTWLYRRRGWKALLFSKPPIVASAAPASSSKNQEAIKTCT